MTLAEVEEYMRISDRCSSLIVPWDSMLNVMATIEDHRRKGGKVPAPIWEAVKSARDALELLSLDVAALQAAREQVDAFKAGR